MSKPPDEPPKPKQPRDAMGRLLPGAKLNPGGRPKALKEVQAAAQVRGKACVKVLWAIVSRSKDDFAVIAAARELLDRGYGKPSSKVMHAGHDGGPLDLKRVPQDKLDALEKAVKEAEEAAADDGSAVH